jgi:hypothetical protein
MRIGLAALAATALLAPALSHERAIDRGGDGVPATPTSRGAPRNDSGEGCCDMRDCAIVPTRDVIAEGQWYTLLIRDRNGAPDIWETIPLAEARPSSDGDYRRCARADGSRRCFFAPPSGG